MKTSLALLGLLAGLILPLGAAPSAQGVGESCDGLPATIVGTSHARLHGTPGDDVIVSNGADIVFGEAGNDTICTTSSVAPAPDPLGYVPPAVTVVGGAGTNVVDRRGDLDQAAGALVFEAQTFRGNDARDVVEVSVSNTVDTGGGDDVVEFGNTVAPFDQISGTVDLGPGDDSFSADGDNGFLEPTARRDGDPRLKIDAGEGEDSLTWNVFEPGSWTFDAQRGRLDSGTRTALGFGGFEHYEVGALREDTRVAFIGTSRGESLRLNDDISPAAAVRSVRMGGGDDEIDLFSCEMCSTGRTGTIDGGRGHDLLKAGMYNEPSINVDLARHRITRRYNHEAYATTINHVEDVQVNGAGTVSITGDGQDNNLRAWGCRGSTLQGGGGDDVLSYLGLWQFGPALPAYPTETKCRGRAVTVDADGGPGDDLLIGGKGPDVLVGGPGHDAARAGQGHDRCAEIEVRKGCEA